MTLYTEKEAAEKWCPYGFGATERAYADGDGRFTLLPRALADARCIGSRCMAWRKGAGEFDEHGMLPGYCGAFGKVERRV